MIPYTLLHGGMVDENATAIQQFIDSEAGNNVGVFLHTIGAAFYIGAALVMMLWAWANRRGMIDPARYHIIGTQWILLAGVGMNGFGGLIRLEQSDHPGLSDLGTNPWVDYIFYKHLFLIAGNLLALFLLIWYVPRRHRVLWWPPAGLFSKKEPPQPDGGERVVTMDPYEAQPKRALLAASIAAFIVLSSLLAGVLGAAANTVGPGVIEEATLPGLESFVVTARPPRATWANVTGTLGQSTPVSPASQSQPVEVPPRTERLVVALACGAAGANLGFALFTPDPVENRGSATCAAGQATATATVDAPQRGTWELRVTHGGLSPGGAYAAEVRLDAGVSPLTRMSGRAVIPPGEFAELNFRLDEGDNFTIAWETEDAPLYFDIHTHDNATGETVAHHQMEAMELPLGQYAAAVTGLHSPFWINNATFEVTVAFVIGGYFTLDSSVGV